MENPVFVETSAGLINLSLVYKITEDQTTVSFWFTGGGVVAIPLDEWHSIRIKMADLVLVD